MKLFGLLALVTSSWVYADVVFTERSTEHQEYKMIGSDFDITVSHPFRLLKGRLKQVQGSLLLNPKNLKQGVEVNAVAKTASLVSEDRPLEMSFAAARVVTQDLTFTARSLAVDGGKSTVVGGFSGELHADVKWAALERPISVPVHCVSEAEYLRCSIQTVFKLTDFGIPLPRKWGIVSRDLAHLSGEVIFSSKR